MATTYGGGSSSEVVLETWLDPLGLRVGVSDPIELVTGVLAAPLVFNCFVVMRWEGGGMVTYDARIHARATRPVHAN